MSSLVQTAYSIYASTLSICFRLTGPDCQSYHVCSKRGLKWNYWRHMSSINSSFSYQIVAFWFKPQVKSLWNFFLSIFPSVFNALGCLQFCMCLVGGRLMKIFLAPTRGSDRPSRVQLVRLDSSPGILLLSLQKLSVKPAQCTRIRPNTNYLTCCVTLLWLSCINTHLPDSGNTWIVVYPLLGVNTHTRFHWETFVTKIFIGTFFSFQLPFVSAAHIHCTYVLNSIL